MRTDDGRMERRRGALVILTAVSGLFLISGLINALIISPDQSEGVPTTVLMPSAEDPIPEERDHPWRIRISSIGLDADVEPVGVTANGNMGTPRRYADVAWYRHGTVPGWKGSAVIAGHLDNGLGLPGSFSRLAEVRLGDTIDVLSRDGMVRTFVVTERALYPLDQVPLDRVFTRDDARRIVLVTCSGSWLRRERTYDMRLVLYAVLTPASASRSSPALRLPAQEYAQSSVHPVSERETAHSER